MVVPGTGESKYGTSAYSASALDAWTQNPLPEMPVSTCPTASSVGALPPVHTDWPGASTVTVSCPAETSTYVDAPRRSACTVPFGSIETSVGSRGTNVGPGAVALPNTSMLRALMRSESTVDSKRSEGGEMLIVATGPGVPVASNTTVDATPVTIAVKAFAPTTVPSVQSVVA